MRRIEAEIRERTGLTCSVGISESRLLAKMTSELGKPDGLVVVSREDALERFGGGLARGRPRDRAEDRRSGWSSSASPPSPSSASGTGRPRRALRPALGRLAARPRQPARRDPDQRHPGDQIAVGRRRPSTSTSAEPRGARADAARADRGALPAAAQEGAARGARSGSRSASTTGPTSRRSQSVEQPTNDPEVVCADRPRPAAGLRPAAPGAPARRPPRLLRATRPRPPERGRAPRRPAAAAPLGLTAA